MKNILVLTDFTENAAHAALSAIHLSKQMHCNILLFHSNTSQPVAPVYIGGPTVIDDMNIMEEEYNQRLKELAASLEPFLHQPGQDWKTELHFEEGLGSPSYQVDDLETDKHIELVVMGARQGSRWDHLFSGSDTFAVIDRSKRPVLIIPSDCDFNTIKKVAFATDFSEADMKAIHYLIKLGFLFNYHLEIIHINKLGDDDLTKNLRKEEFLKHIHRLKYDQFEIKEVYGKDIIDRLSKYCDDSNADLLAFTHYQNSFISSLFNKSVTKKALTNQSLPLMVFPAKFNG